MEVKDNLLFFQWIFEVLMMFSKKNFIYLEKYFK